MSAPERADPAMNTPRRRQRRGLMLVLLAVLVGALALSWNAAGRRPLTGVAALTHQAQPRSTNTMTALGSFAEAAAAGRGQTVRIGLEISNVYNIALAQQTFMANGEFWLNWPQSIQDLMEEQKIEPSDLIQFPNNIVSFDFLIEPTTKTPQLFANGEREQGFRFSGHFFIENIDFHDFPFTTLTLPIRFEIAPPAFSLSRATPVALVANPNEKDLLGSLLEIPGFSISNSEIIPYTHNYQDDDSFQTEVHVDRYSGVMTTIHFRTHPVTAIGQWLLPLLIVMITVFVAPSLRGNQSDLRIAIPSAALLTLVVMQQSVETSIPQLNYLTFLDLVYLWCYTVTLGLFLLFTWSSNRCAQIDSDDPDHAIKLARTTALINRVDTRFQVVAVTGTVIVITALLKA